MKTPFRQFGVTKALSVLEGLKRSEHGRMLFGHLERLLSNNEATRLDIQCSYAEMISLVLEAYAKHLPHDSPLRANLDALYVRFLPPVSDVELIALKDFIARHHPVVCDAQDILSNSVAQLMPMANPEAPATDSPPPTHSPSANDGELNQLAEVHYLHNEIRAAATQLTEHLARQNEEWGIFLDVARDALESATSADELQRLRELIHAEVEAMARLQQTQRRQLKNALRNAEHAHFKSAQHPTTRTVAESDMLDNITQLPNRRAFMQRLEDEVGRVQRYNQPLSLVVIDVDRFGKINDQHGQAAGDKAMSSFAALLRAAARREDMIAHYSADEFAILMPSTDGDAALIAMQHIKARAAEQNWFFDGKEFPFPTISAGVGAYVAGETPTGFVKRIYNALYRAKRFGSDRIELESLQDSSAIFAG